MCVYEPQYMHEVRPQYMREVRPAHCTLHCCTLSVIHDQPIKDLMHMTNAGCYCEPVLQSHPYCVLPFSEFRMSLRLAGLGLRQMPPMLPPI